MSPRARRVTLVIVSLTIAVVGLEIVLRLGGTPVPSAAFRRLFVTDPVIGHRLDPGARIRYVTPEFDSQIVINQAGVRDDDEIGPKPPGEYRVAVVGDSMVLAVQVPVHDTFTDRLERALNAETTGARTYRVINAGVQGYGSVEQYLFFKRVVVDFEPDLVLVVVYAANDATDAADAEARLVADVGHDGDRPGQLAAPSNGRLGLPLWFRRFVRPSAIVQLARLSVLRVLGPNVSVPLRDRPIDAYLVDPPRDVTRGFDVARDAIGRIVDLAQARGAWAALVFMPARFQIRDEEFETLRREYQGRGVELQRDAASERFRRALADVPVPRLDLLPVFRRHATDRALYFEGNSHLTAQGHMVVADAVERFLDAEGLLTPSGLQ